MAQGVKHLYVNKPSDLSLTPGRKTSLCDTMLSSAADYCHLLPISSSSEKATKSQSLAGTGSSLRQPVNSSYLKAEAGSSHIGG